MVLFSPSGMSFPGAEPHHQRGKQSCLPPPVRSRRLFLLSYFVSPVAAAVLSRVLMRGALLLPDFAPKPVLLCAQRGACVWGLCPIACPPRLCPASGVCGRRAAASSRTLFSSGLCGPSGRCRCSDLRGCQHLHVASWVKPDWIVFVILWRHFGFHLFFQNFKMLHSQITFVCRVFGVLC